MNWVNAAYPFERSTGDKWRTILYLSLFLSFLFILLQPFGFVLTDRKQLFVGYMIIGLLTLHLNYFGLPYYFPKYFVESRWSVHRALLFLSYNFLIIGIWVHVYNTLYIHNDLRALVNGYELLAAVFKALIIGLVASAFLILFRYNYLARKHLEMSQELNLKLQNQLQFLSPIEEMETIKIEMDGKLVSVRRKDLVYINSEGNYLSFQLKDQPRGLPHLYRGRMKQLEDQLQDFPEFFRCHRSFVVNLNCIQSIHGNSQGLHLSLIDTDIRIPVSRPKIKDLKTRIAQLPSKVFT